MTTLDLIHDDVKRLNGSVDRVEAKVGEIGIRLALVEERVTKRATVISIVTGFMAGLLGRFGG